VRSFQISKQTIDAVAARELRELERREYIFRGKRPKLSISDSTVILIDDGLATGATMNAATAAVKTKNPTKIVIAVPTGAPDTCRSFEGKVDEVICVATPEPFYAVGAWYEDFSQTTDEEVCELLEKAANFQSK
jgi:predicted phosphoribosyltransferase